MFRQYEDPWKLEEMLEQAEARLEEAKRNVEDDDTLWNLYEDVESLRERVNFAWQDQEYDENYARDYGYEEVWG